MPSHPRARHVAPTGYWHWTPGPWNAITDVSGVRVGHTTISFGAGRLQPGAGPARTGVTVVLPHSGNLFTEKVVAAVHTINGYGKACGFEQVRELGELETPIALTNTLNVWRVADTLVDFSIQHNPDIGIRQSTVNPVVGECNDGYLNDIQGRHVRAEHVLAALGQAAAGPVAEGAVGAGTGTSCYGWKGGIGTASRRLPPSLGDYTAGALVQTNFGRPEELMFAGIPVGRRLQPPAPVHTVEHGSVMIVLATDAPLDARQLHRLCVRAGAGLARTGTTIGHGSGDFVIAFSTAYRARLAAAGGPGTVERPGLADEGPTMAGLFPAVVEAVEEAVLNSLCAATTVEGRDGHVRHALPVAQIG